MTPTLKTPTRPWWLELALVDFRHAFWPWLVYAASVYMMAAIVQVVNGPIIHRSVVLIVLAAVSAVTAQVFCADFAHKTMSTLLVFPRSRSVIWIIRFALCVILLALPVAVMAMVPSSETDLLALISLLAFDALTLGSMLSLILRQTLVAWSAILISPLVIIILCSIGINLLGLDSNSSFYDEFPYAPIYPLLFSLFCGILSIAYAFRLWLRLEVR